MSISYYLWSTYRRRALDRLQVKYQHLYRGVVLDIGGRDRGRFQKPKDKVAKWIFADIEAENNPDLVLDVADMKDITSSSIDVINAMEIFEHVEEIDAGLRECYRVLKNNGTMLISVPFLYPIHADPHDYQRWTIDKWRLELSKLGFKLDKVEVMGGFWTVLGDMIKTLLKSLPLGLRQLAYLSYPLLDLLVSLDVLVRENNPLSKYHGGYFIVLSK